MIRISEHWGYLPVEHGAKDFTDLLRRVLDEFQPEVITLPFPDTLADSYERMVAELPKLKLLHFKTLGGKSYYLSNDPCDVLCESLRQGVQRRMTIRWVGVTEAEFARESQVEIDPSCFLSQDLDSLHKLWVLLGNTAEKTEVYPGDVSSYFQVQEELNRGKKVLSLGSLRQGFVFAVCNQNPPQKTTEKGILIVDKKEYDVHPNACYFALGELPFFTSRWEKVRWDPFVVDPQRDELLKELLVSVGRNYMGKKEALQKISLQKLQVFLVFLDKLTKLEGKRNPALYDMIQACKSVFDDAFALAFLKSAKNYSFFDFENQGDWVEVYQEGFRHGEENEQATNILRDRNQKWVQVRLKKPPTREMQNQYRSKWDFQSMCSHLPEDVQIETFNKNARAIALAQSQKGKTKSEPFQASFLDGLDLRETLRNWHKGQIYVREEPREKLQCETVVLVFDTDHDEKYPMQMVWYAEHKDESTLTFYGTDPFAEMLGPGIAKARYGGLSLLFPPRPAPDPFAPNVFTQQMSLAEKLVWGALQNSFEPVVVYCAENPPNGKMQSMAQRLGKRLQWVSFQSFSEETLQKLRNFHMLNGKEVRAWANRFIYP